MAGLIFDLASLHGQLAQVEFTHEQKRLGQLVVARLVALAFGFMALLFASGALLIAAWDSPYRMLMALALPMLYGAGAVIAWRRYNALRRRIAAPAFTASRRELAADITMLGGTP